MSLLLCTPHAVRVAVQGACVYTLAACLGSSCALARLEETPGTTPIEHAPMDAGELQSFRDAISGAESIDGAYGAMLPEQLLSLGIALQKEGRHAEAVAVFKRGSHLARINNGLYSNAQIPYIQHKITSHIALRQFTEADGAQARLFRVQRGKQAKGEIDIDVLLQQARWQHQAYTLGVGGKEVSFSRLMNMWDLNRLALTNTIAREGDTSPDLLPPLYGMLRAQYLISAHGNHTTGSTINSDIGPRQAQNRFNSSPKKNYDMGRSIIRAIHEIQVSVHGEASLAAAQTRVMMGDWMLWHNAREPAMEAYSLAVGELAGLDDAQIQTENLLGSPRALPDLEGIRPLPPEVSAEGGDILLEFGVSPKGKVTDLVRLDSEIAPDTAEDTELENQAIRLMRSLRRTKFRPRFVAGVAINTEKLVKAYAITH
jgi:hypothetical protein